MSKGITWVGMDVHKASVSMAMRVPGRAELVEMRVANEPRGLRRLLREVWKQAPGEVRCCYEAGPCGFTLQRTLEAEDRILCEVVAPTLIPRKPGDRVKTDRRDARKLCELLEAGLLTEVYPPTPEEEAVRDVCRCREALKDDRMRARHRVSKWLLRRGVVYGPRKHAWSRAHHEWLRALRFEHDADQAVFDDYLLALEQLEQRFETIDAKLEELSGQEPYREPVAWLRCFRGIDLITAMTVLAELHQVCRFDSPRKLMSYLGMTPREYSSGGQRKLGGITKTGNAHVRRLLVEAAWHYCHRPAVGKALRRRRQGQPAQLIAIADKAQHRLYRRFHRLTSRGKPRNKAVMAVARELAGFVWAALNHQEVA